MGNCILQQRETMYLLREVCSWRLCWEKFAAENSEKLTWEADEEEPAATPLMVMFLFFGLVTHEPCTTDANNTSPGYACPTPPRSTAASLEPIQQKPRLCCPGELNQLGASVQCLTRLCWQLNKFFMHSLHYCLLCFPLLCFFSETLKKTESERGLHSSHVHS